MTIFDDPDGYRRWYISHNVTYENERKAVEQFKLRDCLDIGSGPSIFHESMGGNIISLDISEFVLQRIEGDKVQADAHYLPFRDGAFPCIFTSVTICFMDKLEEFMREVERVTKDHFVGCIVKADSSWGQFYTELGKKGHKYYSHAHFITGEEFVKLVNKFFEIDRIVSTLRYNPNGTEVPETPQEGGDGAFVCVKGVKRGSRI
ncbi:class I SAM-dependent methyltransferase [Metallosphaera hakonensis]|uniref:Methyltransferase domain-containing protein n=1 Tax=Metallosphaera hakonensis JCM 8857 = DSM 7519 TaxID=1293036 RepID=A0A2U9ISA6_9CREN|nr:class I SAM-dependent methyltransferase [Metallosphaera hakonensis]AWR98931.1 methyltransferase domain-containing protein [Metallosphaera hakonensis JCM 8857 = DSM 7519]